MKTVMPDTVLDYYDGIQIFTANDDIGGQYIGTMIDHKDDHGRYLVVGVSPANLHLFRCGEMDLRTLLLASPPYERFVTIASGTYLDPLHLDLLDEPLENSSLLPKKGFYLEEEPIEDQLVSEAKDRNNLVLEIVATPPEARAGHRMRAEALGHLILRIQSLVRNAYSAEMRALHRSRGKTGSAPLLDVTVPSAAGSYRMVMEAANPPDMYGYSELSRAMERIDRIFASCGDPTTAYLGLQEHKGHLAGSYIKLMRLLADFGTGLRYRWAAADSTTSSTHGVTRFQAAQLAEALERMTELSTEAVIVTGKLEQANDRTGTWCITDDNEHRHYGEAEDPSTLDGLVIGQFYEFPCIEFIEIGATGKEKTKLVLQTSKPILLVGKPYVDPVSMV